MAEFALGLTKSAVEGALTRVKSAIEEEDKQRVRVQDDLVFITGEFEMMQSFLGVANAERANNPVVRTWVKQLRDLAFDVEDCVEFVIHLDKPSRLDWVRRFTSSVICIARPTLPLDVAVADIKRLKARVEDVSQRNTRYNLISDSGSSSNSAVTIVSTPAVELKPGSAGPTFHTLCEVWEEAGRKRRGTDDLKKLIMRGGSDLEVISLWGSQEAADLGTTQVIKKAYNAPQIRQEFSIRAWVKLLHPFDIDEFLESLLTQLNLAASSNRQRSSGRSHIQIQAMDGVCETDQLVQHMKEQRYLVILEDVRTAAELDDIREYLPDTKNGSRIVVSTQQLGLAISCLQKSYRVAELRKFPHGQSLCAFINKVPDCRSDMSEFIWQLRYGGVISVWGSSESTTILDSVYTSITHKSKAFENEGVEFEKHSWVDVPSPFEFDVFSRRLLLSFHGDDFLSDEVEAVGRMGHQGVVQRCQRFLQEYKCLVVINGLKNKDDWDSIKSTFLSMSTNGCILAITHPSVTDAGVLARYCVDKEDRAINIQYLESDSMLRRLIKGSRIHGIGGKEACRRGRLFSNRREEARNWIKQFRHVVGNFIHFYLRENAVLSLWGTGGAGKSPVIRRMYYYQLLLSQNDNIVKKLFDEDFRDLGFTKFSWVDVPHPFNLMDFCWRLLLDFHSDDLHAKEIVAVSMMEGQHGPIDQCFRFMSQDRCFIVINGLRSTDDWDSIRDALLWPMFPQYYIVIITNEERVATHCTYGYRRGIKINMKDLEAKDAHRSMTKACGYYGNESDEASRFFSNRREEADDWALTSGLVGKLFEDDPGDSFYTHVGLLSLSGISGVGKSTLGRYIYTKMMQYSKKRFTSFSWVDVPQPFNLMELCWRLLLDFHSDDLEAKETATIGMIDGAWNHIQECREFLHKKCFVVIHGLCSTHDWDLIRDALSPEKTEGCILVIANETDVATYCVSDKNDVSNAQCLEPDDALLLFEKVAFGGKQLSPEEIQVSKLIVAKCGGLPKVIAAIGEQYIASEGEIDFLENLNNDFMGTLETKPEFCSLKGLFGWMQSYFDGCSDALKPCVFYLSVFPIVSKIRRGRLLRRWIAEGYSRDKFGITAEKDGENLFLELVGLSIIQEPPGQTAFERRIFNDPDSKVDNVFQVNGFFHEYIISRQLEDNLVLALEGHCDLNSQRVGQHLTIRSSWDRDENVFKSMDLSRLRSLTVFGKWESFFISTAAASSNMRLLRVLDLEDTTSGVTNDVLEHIGKLLPRLKFLSVRGCKEITRVPDSLGGLRQLQTLDVSHTNITKLPCVIINLVKLQYLCAGTTLEPLDQDDDAQPAAVDHDDMSRSQTAVADHDDMIRSQTSAADHDEMSRSQTAVADHDDMSRSQTDHDDMSRSQTSVANHDDMSRSQTDHDDMSRSQTYHDDMSRSQTSVADHDDMSRSQTAVAVAIPAMDGDVTSTIEPAATAPAPAEGENSSSTLMQWKRKTRNLVQSYSCSWSSMKKKKQFDNGGGVKVHAAGFGKLTALHSLGIVNVSGAGGNAILKEMKKLTQLHNLWVSGINQKNWHNLCSVISGHGHLESLSVRFDYEQEGGLCSLNDIPELPDTLKSFRVFGGNARASPTWTLRNPLCRQRHLDLVHRIELTISTQEDIDCLETWQLSEFDSSNFCVKPIQDGELRYGWDEYHYTSLMSATVFKIECNSYKLALVFGPHSADHVRVLQVNCSSATESSLKISGLENLSSLKEVCLKGSYSDELRQYLQQKVDCLGAAHSSSSSSQVAQDYRKPVLKLEPQHSAPYTPCASLKRLFT